MKVRLRQPGNPHGGICMMTMQLHGEACQFTEMHMLNRKITPDDRVS